MKNELERLGFAAGKLFIAENYPEAVGIMTALRTGGCGFSIFDFRLTNGDWIEIAAGFGRDEGLV